MIEGLAGTAPTNPPPAVLLGSLPPVGSNHALRRLARYQLYGAVYQGDQWADNPVEGEHRITLNLARTIVNKGASYFISKPVGYVVTDAATGEGNVEAQRWLDNAHAATHAGALDLEMAITSGMYGDGAFTARWDAELGGPRITAVDPATLDCRWRANDMRTLVWLRQHYFTSFVELTAVQRQRFMAANPAKQISAYDPLDAWEEWTRDGWALTVQGALVDGGQNPYKTIPYVVFPNIRVPGEFWGEGDLVDVVQLQQEYNARMSSLSRMLLVAGYPVAVVSGATADETASLKYGPNQLWTLPTGAKADILSLLQAGAADAHMNYITAILNAIYDASEMPPTAYGRSIGQTGPRSGVALEIELQPLLHKLARKRAIWSDVLERRAQLLFTIARWHGGVRAFPPVRISTTWPPVLPQDYAALVADETSLVGAKLHAPSTAMKALGVADAATELVKVVEEGQALKGAAA